MLECRESAGRFDLRRRYLENSTTPPRTEAPIKPERSVICGSGGGSGGPHRLIAPPPRIRREFGRRSSSSVDYHRGITPHHERRELAEVNLAGIRL